MPLNVTLTQMLANARLKADERTPTRFQDTDLIPFLNLGIDLVWDLLTDANDDYSLKSNTFTTVINQAPYDITTTVAPDFFKLRGIEIQNSSGQPPWINLKRYQWNDRNRYSDPLYFPVPNYGGPFYWYRLQDKNIVLTPTPKAVDTLQLWWTPVAPQLANGSDTFDGINGFEDYAVNYAAIQMKLANQEDVSDLMNQQAVIERKIVAMAKSRDSGAPKVVSAASDLDDYGEYPLVPGRWL